MGFVNWRHEELSPSSNATAVKYIRTHGCKIERQFGIKQLFSKLDIANSNGFVEARM
jgi:hypothetical protein